MVLTESNTIPVPTIGQKRKALPSLQEGRSSSRDTSSSSSNNIDTSRRCFLPLLKECGVIFPGEMEGLQDENSSSSSIAKEDDLLSSYKEQIILDDITPANLRSSIHRILRELQSALSKKEMENRIFDDMEEIIQQEDNEDDENIMSDGNESPPVNNRKVLWSFLRPIVIRSKVFKQLCDNDDDNKSENSTQSSAQQYTYTYK